jgi:hypothetical protein
MVKFNYSEFRNACYELQCMRMWGEISQQEWDVQRSMIAGMFTFGI